MAGQARLAGSPAGGLPPADAAEAGLHYVTDARPGIRRVRHGRGFSYRHPDGSVVGDPAVLARIRRLAIPPAWTDVWICPSPRGHLQATGRDARRRKQYRYHAEFQARRDRTKYARTERFARALPRIRRRIRRDLARRGLPRERVLATVVRLLELTLIRVGNDAYARENRSFGAATLRDRHARIDGAEIRLLFRGKAGRTHELSIRDRRLATIVKRCRDLPGQDLFQYLDDDGAIHDVRSDDINAYIREAAGSDEFSAKDFRTWAGTVLAFRALAAGQVGEAGSEAPAAAPRAATARAGARAVRTAIEAAAAQLGNTPAVARSAHVHPALIDAFLSDGLGHGLAAADADPADPRHPSPAEERAVLRVLAGQASREAVPTRSRTRKRPAMESKGR